MKHNPSALTIGLLTAVASSFAIAQTTPATTEHPTPVGTSQQTADQANRKAIQEGSTATVVRTGPSAADHVKNATSTAGDKADHAKAKVKAKTRATTGDDGATATGPTPKQ